MVQCLTVMREVLSSNLGTIIDFNMRCYKQCSS